MQNAICIPSGSLQVGGLFNFNVNLNLPNLQCDGIAINPLQLTEIDPATGQPYSAAQGAYTSGIFAGGGTGNYSSGGGFGVPPQRTYGLGDSTDIYGEPDALDLADTNEVIQPGIDPPVAGNYCLDINRAIADRRANADHRYNSLTDGHCGVGVRTALCAGGLTYWCTGHGNAYQMGAGLITSGAYYKLGDNLPTNYGAQPGDIIVIQPYGKHVYGHIQMNLGGGQWASDFTTNGMFGVQPAPPPSYTVYRLKPNTTANGNGTCR